MLRRMLCGSLQVLDDSQFCLAMGRYDGCAGSQCVSRSAQPVECKCRHSAVVLPWPASGPITVSFARNWDPCVPCILRSVLRSDAACPAKRDWPRAVGKHHSPWPSLVALEFFHRIDIAECRFVGEVDFCRVQGGGPGIDFAATAMKEFLQVGQQP